MKLVTTDLPGVAVVESEVYSDHRGCFSNIYLEAEFRELGIELAFVQDSYSRSKARTIRGMHFQEPHAQGKLVTVLCGKIWDVALDIRRSSPDFGKWTGIELAAGDGRMLWVPPGFAHGFQVTSTQEAVIHYKLTDYWTPEAEGIIRWNDDDMGITWPLTDPLMSERDKNAPRLAYVEHLPEK
jgi:dTDP-4-dehydrorhamnose 3,5-epimerase